MSEEYNIDIDVDDYRLEIIDNCLIYIKPNNYIRLYVRVEANEELCKKSNFQGGFYKCLMCDLYSRDTGRTICTTSLLPYPFKSKDGYDFCVRFNNTEIDEYIFLRCNTPHSLFISFICKKLFKKYNIKYIEYA